MRKLNLTPEQVQEVAFLATDGLFEENGTSCILCGQPHDDSPGGFCLCTQVPLLVADWLAMQDEHQEPPAGEHLHDADRYHSAGNTTLDGVVAHSEELLRESPPAGEACDVAREVLALDAEATPGSWKPLIYTDRGYVFGRGPEMREGKGEQAMRDAAAIANYRTAAPALARSVLAQAAELASKDAEIARLQSKLVAIRASDAILPHAGLRAAMTDPSTSYRMTLRCDTNTGDDHADD